MKPKSLVAFEKKHRLHTVGKSVFSYFFSTVWFFIQLGYLAVILFAIFLIFMFATT